MNKKKFFIIVSITALIVASATATYIFVGNKKATVGETQSQVLAAEAITFTPDPNFENKDNLSILLLGYGGAGHEGGFLSDVIQVVHFDFDAKLISFISIPRDLFVTLPNGTNGKINTAFSLGDKNDPIHSGSQIAKEMVTMVTGIPIDTFISIDFVGFQVAIGGILDGLEVTVSETLDDKWYPIEGKQLETCGKTPEEVAELTNTLTGFELERQFECRYQRIYYPIGIHHMEGGDALAYVRSRHGSAGGDFSRSKRQQEVLLAVRDKLFTLKALEKIPLFFKTMIALTDTDLTIDTISTLAPKLATAKDMRTQSITLSTQNVFEHSKSSTGAYIVVPKTGLNNWQETRDFVKSELEK
ncbi:MAG: hypothetical protein BroJett025_07520 [Patescibacteria group bacterium]|nr:MAG: hypothetical protein BroJett025_07520 [Patescibacteria group bacterium]